MCKSHQLLGHRILQRFALHGYLASCIPVCRMHGHGLERALHWQCQLQGLQKAQTRLLRDPAHSITKSSSVPRLWKRRGIPKIPICLPTIRAALPSDRKVQFSQMQRTFPSFLQRASKDDVSTEHLDSSAIHSFVVNVVYDIMSCYSHSWSSLCFISQ